MGIFGPVARGEHHESSVEVEMESMCRERVLSTCMVTNRDRRYDENNKR